MKAPAVRWLECLKGLSVRAACGMVTLYLLLLGTLDAMTPATLSLTLFYLMGVAVAGYAVGRAPALFAACLGSTIVAGVEIAARWTEPHFWILVWNSITRFGIFWGVAWVSAEMANLNKELSGSIQQRTSELESEFQKHKTTGRKLSETLERLEQVTNAINEVFWLKDSRTGQFVFVSPAYEQIWGRKIEALKTDPNEWFAGVHPDDLCHSKALPGTETAVEVQDREYRVQHPSGLTRWVRERAFPVRNVQGEVYRVAGIAEDISDRKKTQQALMAQEAQYRAIIATTLDGFCMISMSGHILDLNDSFSRMVGFERHRLIGMHVCELDVFDDPDKVQQRISLLVEGRGNRFETCHRAADGSLIETEISASLLTGSENRIIAFARDITERKRAEKALRAQRDIGLLLGATNDLDNALQGLLKIAIDQMQGTNSGGVYLLNPATGKQQLTTSAGPFSEPFLFEAKASLPAAQFSLQTPAYIGAAELPRAPASDSGEQRPRAVAILPLLHEGSVLGSLNIIAHTANQIPPEARLILEAIAAQASGAIARIRAETALRVTEKQILEISEREQARIGQELHDGLCQQLVILAFDANTLHRELATRETSLVSTAKRMANELDKAITETRQLSRGLFPIRIELDGLAASLEELARSTANRFGVTCQFIQDNGTQLRNAVVVTNLYRIAQEAVNNAIKHSDARQIVIRLASKSDFLELTVSDDGKGMRTPRNSSSGMGLHIMNYRARAIGGFLHVGPADTRGTCVSCCLPLPQLP